MGKEILESKFQLKSLSVITEKKGKKKEHDIMMQCQRLWQLPSFFLYCITLLRLLDNKRPPRVECDVPIMNFVAVSNIARKKEKKEKSYHTIKSLITGSASRNSRSDTLLRAAPISAWLPSLRLIEWANAKHLRYYTEI